MIDKKIRDSWEGTIVYDEIQEIVLELELSGHVITEVLSAYPMHFYKLFVRGDNDNNHIAINLDDWFTSEDYRAEILELAKTALYEFPEV